jgi:hypothetical protein
MSETGPELGGSFALGPVIGAGIALDQGASVPNTVLGFAILVALGVSLSGWALLGCRPAGAQHAGRRSPDPGDAGSPAGV